MMTLSDLKLFVFAILVSIQSVLSAHAQTESTQVRLYCNWQDLQAPNGEYLKAWQDFPRLRWRIYEYTPPFTFVLKATYVTNPLAYHHFDGCPWVTLDQIGLDPAKSVYWKVDWCGAVNSTTGEITDQTTEHSEEDNCMAQWAVSGMTQGLCAYSAILDAWESKIPDEQINMSYESIPEP